MPLIFGLSRARLIGYAALALLVAGLFAHDRIQVHKVGQLKAELSQEREARKADRHAYEEAQKAAKAKNIAEVQRITTAQEKINAEQKSKYERDLARLRAGGLRPEFAAPPGSPGKPGAGADGKASCRADAENVCVPRSILVRAGEIELKANALIDWINAQLGVKR